MLSKLILINYEYGTAMLSQYLKMMITVQNHNFMVLQAVRNKITFATVLLIMNQ